jgi:hypothetical protein
VSTLRGEAHVCTGLGDWREAFAGWLAAWAADGRGERGCCQVWGVLPGVAHFSLSVWGLVINLVGHPWVDGRPGSRKIQTLMRHSSQAVTANLYVVFRDAGRATAEKMAELVPRKRRPKRSETGGLATVNSTSRPMPPARTAAGARKQRKQSAARVLW